jgi:hypothetical protein
VTQYYQPRSFKKTMTSRELPQADMTIEGAHNSVGEEDSSDETYIPSPQVLPHGKGKGLASASGSGAARDEIEEESDGGDGNDGDEEEKVFDVEDILPSSYVDMGALVFMVPQNPGWR